MLVLDYVYGYRQYGKIMLRMAEEAYECEKLDCGVERGIA
jgi:hypothetical protein